MNQPFSGKHHSVSNPRKILWSMVSPFQREKNLKEITSCSSCCASQPWSYSGDGFVFLQLRRDTCRHCTGEFSVLARCFNPSPAEVGVLPSRFLLLLPRAEEAWEQPAAWARQQRPRGSRKATEQHI